METRTLKDARGGDDCERGRGEESSFNKCLSRFMGIDGVPSDISYSGVNTDGTRATSVDISRVERGNSTCKHIDADLCRKYSGPRVKGEERKAFAIFRWLPKKTSGIFSSPNKHVVPGTLTPRDVETRAGNHYSKWPVERHDKVVTCDVVEDSLDSDSVTECDNLLSCETSFPNPVTVSSDPRDRQSFQNTNNFCFAFGSYPVQSNEVYDCISKHCGISYALDHNPSAQQSRNYNSLQRYETAVHSGKNEEVDSSLHGSAITFQRAQGLSVDSPEVFVDKPCHPSLLTSSHENFTSITRPCQLSSCSSSAYPPPETIIDMKPAKIGQLTPIANRSREIDQTDLPPGAGVPVLPTAQPAWLCGGDDCRVSATLSTTHGGSGSQESNQAAANETEYSVDVTGLNNGTKTTTRTTTSTPLVSDLTPRSGFGGGPRTTSAKFSLTSDFVKFPYTCEVHQDLNSVNSIGGVSDCSAKDWKNISPQLTKVPSEINDVELVNIDNGLQTNGQSVVSDVGEADIRRQFGVAPSARQKDIDSSAQKVKDIVSGETINAGNQAVVNVAPKLCHDSAVSSHSVRAQSGKRGDVTKNNFGTEFDECIQCWGDVSEEPLVGSKVQNSSGAESKSSVLTDMNKVEGIQSVVYANVLNDNKSITSSEDRDQQQVCLCNLNNTGQILAVNPQDFHQNRLSHQYLNSALTGQTYPEFLPDTCPHCPETLPDTGITYPFFFTDTGIVDFKALDNFDSTMIFTATATKETSFTEKSPDTCKSVHYSPASHHYYNKSSVFKPLIREQASSPNSCTSTQYDDKDFKNFLPGNGDAGHGNKKENDLQLRLFPQFSQLQCPLHRPSPLASPRQPFQHHPLHQPSEQQQLLMNQFHPHHHENPFIRQQQQQRHSSSHQHHRRNSISSSSSLMHHIKCGPHYIRISPVSLLWTFLSVLVAGTCLLSFLTPYWTVHPDHIHSFGLFSLCVRDQRYSHPRPLCMNFGHQNYYSGTGHVSENPNNNINNNNNNYDDNNNYILSEDDFDNESQSADITKIPSGAWQAACLLFGAGVCVQILGALVSLVVLGLSEPWHHRVALINGYMQTVGVLLLVSGLLLYPVGFSSPFFSYYCDSTRAFCTGHCSMGWSYITAVMATALSIFCPVMSSFAEAQQVVRKPLTVVETTMA